MLHLDLNIGKYDTPDSLDKILDNAISQWEAIYGTGIAEATLALRFKGILERAYKQTGERVAILIDEYDKPLLQAIGNHDLQREFRNTLKPFYGVLKPWTAASSSPCLRELPNLERSACSAT